MPFVVDSSSSGAPAAFREPWLIAFAGSAGAIQAAGTVLAALPHDVPAAVVIVQHRPPTRKSELEQVLMRSARMPVVTAASGDRVAPGVVYVARPDRHLIVGADRRFAYANGTPIKFQLSSANPLLETASTAFDGRCIAVVLTGGGSDATDGVQSVKAHGGIVIVQDPATAEFRGMPEAAMRSGSADYVLPLQAIGPALDAIMHGRPVASAPATTTAS